jgi:hypothetical protein
LPNRIIFNRISTVVWVHIKCYTSWNEHILYRPVPSSCFQEVSVTWILPEESTRRKLQNFQFCQNICTKN